MALVDEVGVERFSMRLLAERLETGTATLYRHFASKEEILVYVVDRLLGEASAGEPQVLEGDEGWQALASARALALYRTLRAHRNLVPLLASQIPIGPNGLAAREATIAGLTEFSFDPYLATRAYTTLGHYIVRSATEAAAGDDESAEARALGEYFRGLDPEAFPRTIAAAETLTEVPAEQEFLEGLRFILDGIECARRRSGA